jgi:hypothetical protein
VTESPPARLRLKVSSQCTNEAGGYGVLGYADWSDGFTETIRSAGPFTVSATRKGPTTDVSPVMGPFLRVGLAGFEPTTSSSRTKRATKLRYSP